jgi:hypothetical protein
MKRWRDKMVKKGPRTNVRNRTYIISHIPGVFEDTETVISPSECFSLLISRNVLQQNVFFTNHNINKQRYHYDLSHNLSRDTTEDELMANFGLKITGKQTEFKNFEL